MDTIMGSRSLEGSCRRRLGLRVTEAVSERMGVKAGLVATVEDPLVIVDVMVTVGLTRGQRPDDVAAEP